MSSPGKGKDPQSPSQRGQQAGAGGSGHHGSDERLPQPRRKSQLSDTTASGGQGGDGSGGDEEGAGVSISPREDQLASMDVSSSSYSAAAGSRRSGSRQHKPKSSGLVVHTQPAASASSAAASRHLTTSPRTPGLGRDSTGDLLNVGAPASPSGQPASGTSDGAGPSSPVVTAPSAQPGHTVLGDDPPFPNERDECTPSMATRPPVQSSSDDDSDSDEDESGEYRRVRVRRRRTRSQSRSPSPRRRGSSGRDRRHSRRSSRDYEYEPPEPVHAPGVMPPGAFLDPADNYRPGSRGSDRSSGRRHRRSRSHEFIESPIPPAAGGIGGAGPVGSGGNPSPFATPPAPYVAPAHDWHSMTPMQMAQAQVMHMLTVFTQRLAAEAPEVARRFDEFVTNEGLVNWAQSFPPQMMQQQQQPPPPGHYFPSQPQGGMPGGGGGSGIPPGGMMHPGSPQYPTAGRPPRPHQQSSPHTPPDGQQQAPLGSPRQQVAPLIDTVARDPEMDRRRRASREAEAARDPTAGPTGLGVEPPPRHHHGSRSSDHGSERPRHRRSRSGSERRGSNEGHREHRRHDHHRGGDHHHDRDRDRRHHHHRHRRSRHDDSDSDSDEDDEEEEELTYDQMVEIAQEVGEVVERGATDADIMRLPTSTFEPGRGGDQNQCMVCLCDFESGDLLRTLPCLHKFHAPCVDQWLVNRASCPVCKVGINQDAEFGSSPP